MKLTRRQRDDRRALAPFDWGRPPFQELNRIRNEINRIFEDPLDLLVPSTTTFFEGGEPTLDVYEDKDKITVRAELPGMKKEDIEISLQGDTLTIAGERKQEEKREEGEMYRSEIYFGRFQRSITLPARVDPNKIQAVYKDGILTVTLPKSEEAKPKQIKVGE